MERHTTRSCGYEELIAHPVTFSFFWTGGGTFATVRGELLRYWTVIVQQLCVIVYKDN